MNNNTIRGGQIQWISSLRGLLVLLVFISHLTNIPTPHSEFKFVIGRIGVVGFFLISGYLAVTSVSRRSLGQFYLNRFLRIYPMFWILVILTFLLQSEHSVVELLCNMTLFEEFMGFETMIGSSWMLPIMVIFFGFLPFALKSTKRLSMCWWVICAGCVGIALLRYFTGKPFPTALCLLMCVGLLGVMDKLNDEGIRSKLVFFEALLVVCAWLSYGDRVVAYFVAYNLGFITYYIFQHRNLQVKALDVIGEQGFTFFLGAGIPISFITKLIPSVAEWNWYSYALLQFVTAFVFAYILTRWCEKPLLAWGKKMEGKIKIKFND